MIDETQDSSDDPFLLNALWSRVDWQFAGNITTKSHAISPVVETFLGSFRKTFAFSTFLPHLVGLTTYREFWQCTALLSVLGHLDDRNLTDEQRASVTAALKAEAKKWQSMSQNIDAQWKLGVNIINEMLTYKGQFNAIRDGINELLTSVILSAWTAFEVLAGDLWEAAVNARPRLGFIALGAVLPGGSEDTEPEVAEDKSFTLPVRLLQKWDYEIKNRMGTILKEKWDFSKRNDARDA